MSQSTHKSTEQHMRDISKELRENPQKYNKDNSGCFSIFLIIPLILILSIYCL